MTAMERVWVRIKGAAQDMSRQAKIPNNTEARIEVLRFFREEDADSAPDEAVQFLTSELMTLASEYQRQMPAER